MDDSTKAFGKPKTPPKTQSAIIKPPGANPAPAMETPGVGQMHSKHDAGLATKEGRSARIKEINSSIANRPPQMSGGVSGPFSQLPKPQAPSAQPANAKPQNSSKQFSILDRLRSHASNFANTIGKLGKQVQGKSQNAAAMPGVNQKMIKAEDIVEMMDLLKGQMSKLGKPGLSERMGAEHAKWAASPEGQATAAKFASQAKPSSAPKFKGLNQMKQEEAAKAGPPHASMTKPSTPVAAPTPAKPLAPHVAEVHSHAQSRAHHNKIKAHIVAAKQPVVQPNPIAHPQPQDHAVKSPENKAHFESKMHAPIHSEVTKKPGSAPAQVAPPRAKPANVIAAGSQKAKQLEQTAGAAKPAPQGSSKVVPKADPRNQKAVAAQDKQRFESEKTAPHEATKDNGWKASSEEETREMTRPGDENYEKTVKQKYGDIDSVDMKGPSVHGEKAEPSKEAPVSQRSESKPATVVARKPGAGPQQNASPVAADSNKTPALGKPSQASSEAAAPQSAAPHEVAHQKIVQTLTDKGPKLPTRSLKPEHFSNQASMGVKKPFVSHDQAHGHLMTFLHQLVNPGGTLPGQQPGDKTAVQHSKHFMHKSETDVLGKTRSGKNVYNAVNHPSYKDFSADDHGDAYMMHQKHMVASKTGDYMKSKGSHHHDAMITHGQAEKNKLNKKDINLEQTAKDSVGATAAKIKEGAKDKPASEQAKLLTDPANHPPHNRRKLLQMVRKCGKVS